MNDPKNKAEVSKIMGARVGLSGAEYGKLLKGTFILGKAENVAHFKKGTDLTSVYGSNKIVDKFNLDYEVYKETQGQPSYLDPSLVLELAK